MPPRVDKSRRASVSHGRVVAAFGRQGEHAWAGRC